MAAFRALLALLRFSPCIPSLPRLLSSFMLLNKSADFGLLHTDGRSDMDGPYFATIYQKVDHRTAEPQSPLNLFYGHQRLRLRWFLITLHNSLLSFLGVSRSLHPHARLCTAGYGISVSLFALQEKRIDHALTPHEQNAGSMQRDLADNLLIHRRHAQGRKM